MSLSLTDTSDAFNKMLDLLSDHVNIIIVVNISSVPPLNMLRIAHF